MIIIRIKPDRYTYIRKSSKQKISIKLLNPNIYSAQYVLQSLSKLNHEVIFMTHDQSKLHLP